MVICKGKFENEISVKTETKTSERIQNFVNFFVSIEILILELKFKSDLKDLLIIQCFLYMKEDPIMTLQRLSSAKNTKY